MLLRFLETKRRMETLCQQNLIYFVNYHIYFANYYTDMPMFFGCHKDSQSYMHHCNTWAHFLMVLSIWYVEDFLFAIKYFSFSLLYIFLPDFTLYCQKNLNTTRLDYSCDDEVILNNIHSQLHSQLPLSAGVTCMQLHMPESAATYSLHKHLLQGKWENLHNMDPKKKKFFNIFCEKS